MKYSITVFVPGYSFGKLVPGWIGKRHELTISQLRKACTEMRHVRDKSCNKLWSPAIFEENRRRAISALSVCALVYDVDGNATFEEVRDHYAIHHNFKFWMHTSHNHSPERHRFRVVIPLAEPCPSVLFPRLWHAYAHKAADGQAKDVSRAYYLPSAANPEHYMWHVNPVREMLSGPWERLPKTRDELKRESVRAVYKTLPASKTDMADPRLREDICRQAGGNIVARPDGMVARGITCPQCGRPSVWYPIVPLRIVGAMCAHTKTCNWVGSVKSLTLFAPKPTLC